MLAVAMQAHRRGASLREVAELLGVSDTSLSRAERGQGAPSVDTAIALARWLGWSVEQVIEAARTPVQGGDDGQNGG